MSFYEDKVLPHVLNCACSNKAVDKLRAKVVPFAEGEVLEVGIGSALNMHLYDPSKVTRVWGLEPSHGMRERAQKNLAKSTIPVDWLDLPGEKIPLEDNSVDTVLLTFTLCTIPDWAAAMIQMHRVLKPGGKLLFCEHGLSPDESIQHWQNKLNNVWGKVFGGCNLNRPVIDMIESSGFSVDWHHSDYAKGIPKVASFASFMTHGVASKI